MTLNALVKSEYDRDVERSKKRLEIMTYSGQIYTDQYLIEHFPLKLKVEERLKKLKELMFYLASSYNIADVKNNQGFYFTKDTFLKAGLDISGMQQSNWIKGMKNCGLIYVINKHYQFGHGKENFCKLYGLNQLGIIKSFPQEYQKYLEEHNDKSVESTVVDIAENISVEVFNKKQKQIIKSGFTQFNKNLVDNFDKQVIVDYTKGTISDFKRMLDEYNEDKSEYNKKRLRFKCEGKKITGRAYSKYIATENDDERESDRTVWCKQNGLKYRYDIKSAVPRISHLMLTGEWKDEDFDFYNEISVRSGLDFSREHMKTLHMRLRFGKSAEKSFSEFCFSNANVIKQNYPSGDAYESWLYDVKPKIFNDWKTLYKICEELEGTDHSSSVFYFESYLELYVVWKLKQMGITAYNVYDEFYYDKECDISSVIAEAANYIYNKVGNYYGKFRKRDIPSID